MVTQMYKIKNDHIMLMVKVRPLSGQNKIVGIHNDELVIKVKAQPEKGKANKELVSFLSRQLNCRKTDITIVTGETSQHKLLELPVSAQQELDKIIDNGSN